VVWLQNIGEKGVKWRMRERKWNLLGVSKPYNWSLLQVFMTVLIGLIDFIAYV